jgi:pilus assembly protein TadC
MRKTNRKHLTQIESLYEIKKAQRAYAYKQESYKKIMIAFFLVMATCIFLILIF